jgi:TnpA family transposase
MAPAIEPLMGRCVKLDMIRAHWDDLVRLVTSLKDGTVQPSVGRVSQMRRIPLSFSLSVVYGAMVAVASKTAD